MAFNRKQKLRDNIEAIKTAFILDREQRTPTARERLLLERYCGFGGLKCILNPAKELTDAVHWAKSDLELFTPTVELHRLIRENSKDDYEYKRYMDGMKQSVLTAFYTPAEITVTIADMLHRHGIRPDRVLEPSAGVGAFVDAVLENKPDADIMAFEKDLMTGKILGHLHPEQKIRVQGFEKIEKPFMGHFDLAISNIPFGDVAVFDPEFSNSHDTARRSASKTIHNYFFLKSLDAMREGGIVAFITSQGVMDSDSNMSIRAKMLAQADLVSAIRLPNNLFTENANTEVGSDLIVLQKNSGKGEPTEDELRFVTSRIDPLSGVRTNDYFSRYSSRIVFTDYKTDTDPYGKPARVFTHSGGMEGIASDLYKFLSDDFSRRLDLQRFKGVKAGEQQERPQSPGVKPVLEQPQEEWIAPVSKTEEGKDAVKPEPQSVEEKPEIDPPKRQEKAVQLTLLDLWGMTEEASQPKAAKKKKTAKKEGTAKRTTPKTQVQTTPKAIVVQTASTVKPVAVNKEEKAENTVKPADPDDVYATLDWETNPPINGFYEMMWSLTPERRKELREIARLHNEKQGAAEKAELKAMPETPHEQPRQPEVQPEVVVAPAATDTPSEVAATSLFPETEAAKPKEEVIDLSPRPYHRTPEMKGHWWQTGRMTPSAI